MDENVKMMSEKLIKALCESGRYDDAVTSAKSINRNLTQEEVGIIVASCSEQGDFRKAISVALLNDIENQSEESAEVLNRIVSTCKINYLRDDKSICSRVILNYLMENFVDWNRYKCAMDVAKFINRRPFAVKLIKRSIKQHKKRSQDFFDGGMM